MLILGIDPGSINTGYGIIRLTKQGQEYVTSGHIKIFNTDLGGRLKQIYVDLLELMEKFRPQQVSIEKVFVHKNISSALKLGQARGVAMVAAANMDLPIYEYSPRKIKLTVTGFGGASKEQIQAMVKHLLSLDRSPQQDAADALAIAICHGIHFSSKFNINCLNNTMINHNKT